MFLVVVVAVMAGFWALSPGLVRVCVVGCGGCFVRWCGCGGGGGVVCGWFGVCCFSSCSGCFGVVWIGGDACFLGVSGGCVVWFTVGGFALLAWLV